MQLNQGGTALSGAPVHDYGVQGRFLYAPKFAFPLIRRFTHEQGL